MTTKKAAASAHKGRAKAAKPENTPKKHALTPAMEARKWKPGESGNPGGRPKKDVASDIAQQLFEGNAEMIARAMLRQLRKGNAKVFAVLADRAWGKPHQQIDVTGQMNVSVVIDL
jgi:hypothetical protein